jgi:hypothetical protein
MPFYHLNVKVFGWTTHGHAGADVPLWSYAGKKFDRPVGLFDNTDLAKISAKFLGCKLFGSKAWMEVDGSVLDMTDPQNPVAVIRGFKFPVSKDIVITPWGKTFNLKGITVWAPKTNKVYLPLM